jgi:hypothetical protein
MQVAFEVPLKPSVAQTDQDQADTGLIHACVSCKPVLPANRPS